MYANNIQNFLVVNLVSARSNAFDS